MTDELKPVNCGCGGEAKAWKFTWEFTKGCWYVKCLKCAIGQLIGYPSEAEAVEAWNKAMSGVAKNATCERTAKALNRELDAVVRFEEGGVTFTYDKGTNILHECESCGTFVKPGEIYCHNCGARLEWE